MKSNIIKDKIKKIMAHRHFQKYEKYISLVVWMAAIYYLSNQSLGFFSSFDIWSFILRKMAHMFEFAVLTFLIFRILRQTEKKHIYWDIGWALIFAVLYAASDEYHQSFISGRVGTYRDVLIDSAGVLVACWLIYLDFHHRKIMESKNIPNKIVELVKGKKE